jgi:hypothetical protein
MATISTIRSRLLPDFPQPQADLLARVFVESHDELVTKAEVNQLTGVVRELAEASDDDIRTLFFGSKADRKARELIVSHGAAMVFTRGVMIPKTDAAA